MPNLEYAENDAPLQLTNDGGPGSKKRAALAGTQRVPWQIQGNNVDHVVVLDKVGEPEKIVSGTTQITKSPDRLFISELTAKFVKAAGIMTNGFSFQAGAGGTALASVQAQIQDAEAKLRNL